MDQPMMITMVLLVWDVEQQHFYYTGAGHDPFFIYRRQSGKCEIIQTGGVWLGVLDDADDLFELRQLQPEPGDMILLYTDGVTEYHNQQQEMFGQEQLHRFVCAQGNNEPAEIIDRLMAELEVFGNNAVQHDDITVLALKRDGA